MGITWAVAWAVVGIAPRWILGFNPDAPFPIIFGALGFFAGATFAVLLALTQGRRGFEEISRRRFVWAGAVGGLLLAGVFARVASLAWGDVAMIAPIFAAASGGCAAASLALARRGHRLELSEPARPQFSRRSSRS